MKNYELGKIAHKSISGLTILSLLMPNLAYAAQPVLATKPLGSAVSGVKPNLMYVLDGSGSMSKEAPNDTLKDSGQCKAAVKNVNKLATIKKIEVSSPNTRLKISATSFGGVGVGNQIYLTIPGKPTLSGLYTIKVKTDTASFCPITETITVNQPYKFNEIAHNAGTLTNVPGFAPINRNPTSWGGSSPQIYNPQKLGEYNPTINNPYKYGEFAYVNGDPPTPGCKVTGTAPTNSQDISVDRNLGGGYKTDASGNATSVPSTACYWRDNKDVVGCKVVSADPGNSGDTANDKYYYGVQVLPDGSTNSTTNTNCYWKDPKDVEGCKLPSNPGNSFLTSNQSTPGKVIDTSGNVTTTDTWNCGWYDQADTNGCHVVGTSGFVITPDGTYTSTPSGACGQMVAGASTGCRVTSAQPANTPNYTTDLNQGGGKQVDTSGTVTASNDSRCYWLDPKDTKSCPVSTYSQSYIEVEIAPESAFVYDSALSDPEVVDAYIANSNNTEVTTCFGGGNLDTVSQSGAEPPLRAAKINSLSYDPTISYQPPPWPKKVGAGIAAPLAIDFPNLNSPSQAHNLLPSMDRAQTNNWREVRMDGTALDASGNPNSAFWGGATGSTANVGMSSVSPGMGFNRWPEMVWCDTPDTPAQFLPYDRPWHESTRCQHNSPGANTTPSSSNWPYHYPAVTSGVSSSPNLTNFYINEVDHQNGQPLGIKNPTYNFGGGTYHVFGEVYKYAYPYYYDVTPIEYCTKPDLKDCSVQSASDTTYKFPAYVRYCKTAAQATDLSSGQTGNCQATYSGNAVGDYRYARYGLFEKTEVRPDVLTYAHSGNSRTDCANPASCTYDEEMTNMANWFAYYRTRMQLMKSASGRGFSPLDGDTRVGLITIDSDPTKYLPIADFNTGVNYQKQKWYEKLYKQAPSGGTPLRDSLATVGRIFAGQHPITGFGSDDPMQYSCQSNYTLLTTDGYWTENPIPGLITEVNGLTAIGNKDSGVSVARPKREDASNPMDNTLADVSKYYFDTDIRTTAFGNCSGALGDDVCINDGTMVNHQYQHMNTYTLGLGVDGNLASDGYLDATTKPNTDYPDLEAGLTEWPKPTNDDGVAPVSPAELATVDDLWHAAVNSEGEYYSAKNPQSVIDGISRMLNSIEDTVGAGSAVAVSNILPVAGDNYAYSSRYLTGAWTGNLFARTIDGDGVLSTNALWCVENEASVTPACVGSLASKVSASADTRSIYTNVGGVLTSFEYANLTALQKLNFDASHYSGSMSQFGGYTPAQLLNVSGDNLVKYLRGQSEFDYTSTDLDKRLYRHRDTTLGDVVESPPTLVAKAALEYGDNGYGTFLSSTVSSGRSTTGRTIYVGANDGMLHAFNANDGTERWAFIPTTVLPNLWKLADADYRYKHTNFINGPMHVTDICTASCGSASAVWKTILVSGLGQGGRGYFALDVTDPTAPSLLWEVNSSTMPNLGYSYGKPVITKMSDGTWVALLTSGYNNTSPGDGKGYLYVLNAYTGALIKTFATGAGDTTTPSGLAQVSSYASDPTKDFTSQYVYGGDLLGNLWRININTSAAPFKITTLEAASTAQPIMVAPTLASIYGKRVVILGTGKYIETSDLLPAGYSTQSIYAIKDDDISTTITGTALRSSMVQQTFTTDVSGDSRTLSNNPIDWSNKRGWFIDLDTGERENIRSQLESGILYIPTLIPSTGSCDVNGRGWLNIIDVYTGSGVQNYGDTTPPNLIKTSFKTTSPIVGLTLVGSVGPNNEITIRSVEQCVGGDCNANEDDKELEGNGMFKNTRAIWRELIE